MLRKRKGFTLMEMLVVLGAVIALASGAFVVGNGILQSGRIGAARGDVAGISLAVAQFHFETGAWPASLNDLTAALGDNGPWISQDWLTDPWGKAYNFSFIAAQGRYAVWSDGPNGRNDSGGSPTAFSGDDIGVFGR